MQQRFSSIVLPEFGWLNRNIYIICPNKHISLGLVLGIQVKEESYINSTGKIRSHHYLAF